MQLIETSIGQRSQLPLPSAALVIDVRGIQDDEVIEWLHVEIADLANEMKTYNVHHWRYLTEFISVQRIQMVQENEYGIENAGDPEEDDEPSSLTGVANPTEPENALFFNELRTQIGAEDVPFNYFEQKIDELIQEIDRIRNNRIAAVKDLNNAAIPGRSNRDSTVRVIFLTDLKYPESLSTAAIYAERLKAYYRKLEKPNHQMLLNTTVLCLSNSGEAGPPALLIQRLARNNSWEHLDSLILSENYREDAAQIAGPIQAYIAELLLYVLLIIPPLQVSSSAIAQDAAPKHAADDTDTNVLVGLPQHTFIVGLAALEYSARWGRRWLNFGLAKEVTNVLRQKLPSNNKEKVRQADIAASWFHDWLERVRQTIPDEVPGEIPALEGIFRAREVSHLTKQPFTGTHFYLHVGDHTTQDLNDYLTKLAQTYATTSKGPALQDALTQSPAQIMQALREKDDTSLAERRVTPLGKLQIEAEQILRHPKFFTGSVGALPRAQAQLEAIGTAISHFSQDHQNHPLNPLSMKDTLHYRKQELEKNGKKRIDQLKKHLDRWPFVSGTTFSKLLLAMLTLLLIGFMSVSAIFTGFAWLHHLIELQLPGFVSSLDALLFGSIPLMAVIGGGLAAVVLALEAALFWPPLVNKKRSALSVEVTFLVMLVVFMLFGFFINASLTNLVDDPTSIYYLLWLSFVPGLGITCGLVALVLVIGEICYTIWWLHYLMQERQRISSALQQQHHKDIQDVTNFIADDIALELVLHAELTDGNGGLGSYYFRVARTCNLLDDIAEKARYQQELASKRLLLSQSEAQQTLYGSAGSGTWLDLHIRDEKMQMEKLTEVFKDLKQKLVKENTGVRELAEFILRVTGTEKAVDVGKQIEDASEYGGSNEHRLDVFMQALIAITMRFSIEPLSIESIEQLIDRYKDAYTCEYARETLPALSTLLQMLNKRNSQVTLQSFTGQDGSEDILKTGTANSHIAVSALATWGQLFWQQKNRSLEQTLKQDGVLAHLQRLMLDDYDPRAVMRRLLAFTVFLGRSSQVSTMGDLYLLLAPSPQSRAFRQGIKSPHVPRIVDFPDVERILLLGVKRFVAEPMQLLPTRDETQKELPDPGQGLATPSAHGAKA